MPRASLLTNGLDGLAAASPAIARMLDELYALDDVLQDAHAAATRDDENGERVVEAYEKFLRHREQLIKQLEREKVAVPWQMRMRIDDIELTLHQRKEKREQKAQQESDGDAATEKSSSKSASAATPSAAEQDAEKDDPLLMLKAMILPSALMGLIACIVYFTASFAD